MNFEEQFPGLKGYNNILVNRAEELKAIEKSKDDSFSDYDGVSKKALILIKKNEINIAGRMIKDIQDNCLDKAKVREAIDDGLRNNSDWKEDLKDKLGLE